MIVQFLNNFFSNIYSLIFQISLTQVFKITCICLFILINIYLFFLVHIYLARDKEQPKVLQAGIIDSHVAAVLKNVGKAVAGVSSFYGGWVSLTQDRFLSSKEATKAKAEVTKLQTEIDSLQSQLDTSSLYQDQTKTSIRAFTGRLAEQHEETKRNIERFLNLQEDLKGKTTEISKAVSKPDADAIASTIITLTQQQAYVGEEIRRSLEKTTEIQTCGEIELLNTTHEAGWWLDLSFFTDYYDSLNTIGKFALSLLIFNQIILSSITSIVFIIYGEYLIKRYQIEERFPKLATIIKLRRKFQTYYLFISVAWVFVIILIESFFCILILTA